MVSEKLEVGFSPPPEEDEEADKLDLIVEVIEKKGCSYPAEIGGELNISNETVYRKLRFLAKEGRIERMYFKNPNFVPGWLEPRIKELWSRNIKGNAIRRISWYTVVKDEKED